MTMRTQKEEMAIAFVSTARTQQAFLEIQAGPNPLMPDEVRRLIERRPDRYATLHAFASRKP
jgi:hypothetical protein